MAAYVILDIDVTDPVRYEDYKRASTEVVARYGGKFLVRGGKHELLEGGWDPHRLVVLEFQNAAKARAWWTSEDYAKAKAIRLPAARAQAVLVEGA
jgi:uncharacterized protein (DUF1330 family)